MEVAGDCRGFVWAYRRRGQARALSLPHKDGLLDTVRVDGGVPRSPLMKKPAYSTARQEAFLLFQKGTTAGEVAEELGAARSTAYKWQKVFREKVQARVERGEEVPSWALHPQRGSTTRRKALDSKLGYIRGRISKVVRGRPWWTLSAIRGDIVGVEFGKNRSTALPVTRKQLVSALAYLGAIHPKEARLRAAVARQVETQGSKGREGLHLVLFMTENLHALRLQEKQASSLCYALEVRVPHAATRYRWLNSIPEGRDLRQDLRDLVASLKPSKATMIYLWTECEWLQHGTKVDVPVDGRVRRLTVKRIDQISES